MSMTTGAVAVEPDQLHPDDALFVADLQLGQVVAEPGEQLIELGHRRHGLDGISGGEQRRSHRLARPANTGRVIGEDVDVLGGAVDDAVGNQDVLPEGRFGNLIADPCRAADGGTG